ncbi:MAG: PhoH family protein [Alphaproteobacteria bacterium]|nr:PhoH family protein [Alphaproteobacteria bacterium]
MATETKEKKKNAAKQKPPGEDTISLSFDNNSLLSGLYGEQDENLTKLERKFGITAVSRGNVLVLAGDKPSLESARAVIENLYSRLKKGDEITSSHVDAALRMIGDVTADSTDEIRKQKMENVSGNVFIKTQKKTITPYSHAQAEYFKNLYDNDLVFALGPAGTGKTYIAVAMAVYAFINKHVDRIILSRPAVEAGEKLGFLPGDLKDKIDPYLRPLYDALYDMLPAEKVVQYIETGEIEVAPLAFMRGRTLGNAYVILDEAQNTTPTQMKMFLTRMGENSRMVVTGDLSQCDLPRDVASGLRDAVKKLEGLEGIGCTRFSENDVVRHALAARIVKAYEEWDRRKEKKNDEV